jgi:serine O-acetyltransferase
MNSAQLSTAVPDEKMKNEPPDTLALQPRKKGAFARIRADIQSVFDRDPAARSVIEVLLTYPGLHAIWGHRLSHWYWTHHLKLLGRVNQTFFRWLTGIEIHPGATIGEDFFIDHGMGVVIGETAEVGRNVTLYHGVTLGGVSLNKGKRHPTLEDNVVVGAGAKVLGAITIGASSRIGANAVVVKDVPPDSVVVGVPGQIVHRTLPHDNAPDLAHNRLPDMLTESIVSLMQRVDAVESTLHLHGIQHPVLNGDGAWKDEHPGDEQPQPPAKVIHAPQDGEWRGEDFQI